MSGQIEIQLERVVKSVPIDRIARAVTGRGEHYVSAKKLNQLHSCNPLPMRPVPLEGRPFVGLKCGRFTVLGLHAHNPPKGNALWVVRCACGNYETRRLKAIRNPNNTEDCCQQCLHVVYLKRRSAEGRL